jgi:transcriptional regulator GlxA family with amidase domain
MQIAFNCGFADASHFSREFRALFFETPRDVRKCSAEKSTH